MSELKINKEKVIAFSKKCSGFRDFAKALWPEIFEEEMENISNGIKAVTTHHMGKMGIEIYYGSEKIGFINPNTGITLSHPDYGFGGFDDNIWEIHKKWGYKQKI